MTYLLDTNICIAIIHRPIERVARRFDGMLDDEIALCSIVRGELLYGAYRSQSRARNYSIANRFVGRFRSLPFNDAAADEYARIRADLASHGFAMAANDLMIASIALANDLIVVTNDAAFERVPELVVENWLAK